MTTTQAVACPKCSGAMWDNRLTKRNPKQPDFKCKDPQCDGVIWPPKNGNGAAAPATRVDNTPRAYSSGPHIPGIDGPCQETGAPPAGQSDESVSRLDGVLSLHDVCVMHATKSTARILKDAGFTPTAADILAAAATQMIGAQKIGARVG
jgi:hypothetical protein